MNLYEVAIITKLSKKEQEEGAQSAIVLAPFAVVAADENGAVTQAILSNADKLPKDMSKCQTLVRSFR